MRTTLLAAATCGSVAGWIIGCAGASPRRATDIVIPFEGGAPLSVRSSAVGSAGAADPAAVANGRKLPMIVGLSTSDADCGLDADGRVWIWPAGEVRAEPSWIGGARGISCSITHTCVIAYDKTVWCWGGNSYGALGNGTEKPSNEATQVVDLRGVAEISVDIDRTCARTESGDVFCWGDSEFGKAGDGRLPDNVGREKITPGKPILSGAVSLDVGESHACAVLADGRLSCWGQNHGGSCGQPLRTRYVPRPQIVAKVNVVSVNAGVMDTCTIDHVGAVACFGTSFVDSSVHPVPQNVALPGKATAVVVGGQHACALLEGGAVFCWGDNYRGQLGDGTNQARATAAPVKGIGKATRIALSNEKTCAIVEGGRVFCWGEDATQIAATGMSESSSVPLEITLPRFPD